MIAFNIGQYHCYLLKGLIGFNMVRIFVTYEGNDCFQYRTVSFLLIEGIGSFRYGTYLCYL